MVMFHSYGTNYQRVTAEIYIYIYIYNHINIHKQTVHESSGSRFCQLLGQFTERKFPPKHPKAVSEIDSKLPLIYSNGYGSIPTYRYIFSGMNIHKSQLFCEQKRGTRFWHTKSIPKMLRFMHKLKLSQGWPRIYPCSPHIYPCSA